MPPNDRRVDFPVIEPLDGYIPAKWTPDERKDRERCSEALQSLRRAWRLCEDAGRGEALKNDFMALADKVKAGMGGKEKDGFDG